MYSFLDPNKVFFEFLIQNQIQIELQILLIKSFLVENSKVSNFKIIEKIVV